MKDIIIALIGFAVLSSLLFVDKKKDIKENFWGLPNRTYKVEKEFAVADKYGRDMYTVPPNYQGVLSPRFSNVDYGANIRYNMPVVENLASPENPLTYGKSMVDDLPSAGMPSCNQVNMANPRSMENYEPIGRSQMSQELADNGIVKAMNQPKGQAGEGITQPIVYDRFLYANQRSRLYGLGDPIRGDIAITPIKDQWFRPSVYPNIDLRAGAMTIMGGIDNDTSNELRALQSVYTHGNNPNDAYNQIVNPALAQKSVGLSKAQGDISVTAFP